MTGRALALLMLVLALARAGLFDLDGVSEIRLQFAQPNWDEILDSLYAAGEEGRLVGSATVDGVRFDSVGVRYKGASSYNPSRRKNPFNIKLDYAQPGQAIEGHGTLRLANVYKDPSFVREVLAYEIARRYMAAGRSAFVNVWVNDTLIGLYTCNEDPDKRFMREHFLCDGNARFKGRLTDSSQMSGWKYFGPDSAAYRHYYEMQSDSGWAELVGFLDTFNNRPELVERVLDVDRHLWMLAFDIVLVNLDAPVNMPQNFYLYRDASGRFCPVVWDLNESFGAFRDLCGTGQLNLAQMQALDAFLRSGDENYPICSRVFADARLRRMYVAHARTMLAETFASGWYRSRAEEIQDAIDAHVRADPNKFYTYNDFLNNITRSVGTGPLAIVGLTELMGPRVNYLSARPEFTAAAPTIGTVLVTPPRPTPGASVSFTAGVSGADSVFLGWRQNPAHRFERVAMADSGGGQYAATVRVGAGNVEYYIYAENDAAGAFEPARAEREFRSLPVTASLVINELMAINNSTVRDPSGQFDDWLEIVNNTDRAISLDGYLLSDDSAEIVKWSFPDVALAPRGRVIVWADNDSTQPGLHASFTLAGGGGTVLLSDPDGRPLDRVTFGQQYADVSFGRYPDAAGAFRLMNPTPGWENDSAVGTAEPGTAATLSIRLAARPNPFARATRLGFALARPGRASLRVYDAAGRVAAVLLDGERAAGQHEAEFAPAGAMPGGVYFARLEARTALGAARESIKLVVTR